MDQPTFLIYDPSAAAAYSMLNPTLLAEDADRPLVNPPLIMSSWPSFNYTETAWGGIANTRPFQRAIFSDLGLFNGWIAKLWGLPPEAGSPSPIIVMGRNAISRGVRMSRADIYRRAKENFDMRTPAAKTSLILTPSLVRPNWVRPFPSPLLTRPLTARTPIPPGGPIPGTGPVTLIYDPAYTSYPEYQKYRGYIGPTIEEGLDWTCSDTFRPCPGFRTGVFADLALFNAWIAKIWGLPPETGSVTPIVVLGRRDIVRGGAAMPLRNREIRADTNYAADPDTNTRPPIGTPVPTPGGGGRGGGLTPAAPMTVWGGTIQIFGPSDCAACVAAMNYLRSIRVSAEKIDITTTSDSRLASALARASVSVRGSSTPIIIHTRGTPRLTQGFNEADLRARYFVSAPVPEDPAPRPPAPGIPRPPAPALPGSTTPIFTSTFAAPLTYAFAAEGTAPRSWSFGDDTTSVELNPTHTYAAPGTYTISLRMPTDSTRVTTSTLEVLAEGTPGTIIPSTPPAPVASKSTSPFPFLIGAGLMYGVFSLWRKLRR